MFPTRHKSLASAFGSVRDGKFDKPTETCWIVTWRAAAVLEGQWDQVLWLASEWALSRSVGEQTGWEPVYKLLVQAQRDAQQSVECECTVSLLLRSGRGCCRFSVSVLPVPVTKSSLIF